MAMKQVFSHPDVEQLELQGYRVISGLLDIYQPLLKLSLEDFSELVAQERVRRLPIASRLYQKLSTRHRLAYVEAVNKTGAYGARICADGILLSLPSDSGLYQRDDGFVCVG
ncbi:Deoxyguanosinetriphosphate triphosphohydrolase, subgroup 1 [Klebsiella pneumoniae ISC21]|nr:Deoxyguanosinetriphosphate triphosphohydrolase, subgroup 1 [Klebsiella pneumoniae ISC21]